MSAKMTSPTAAGLPARFEPLLLEFLDSPQMSDGLWVIGTDSVCALQADPESGRVRAFDPLGELPTRFVNSTVEQLAGFIGAYRQYGFEVRAARDDSDVRQIVSRLRRTFAELDPDAIADPESWWSVVLEQVDDGLL